MTAENMVKVIDRQLKKLDTVGSNDMMRLRRDLEQHADDASLWFELGIAINQAAMHRDYLLVEHERLLHPDQEKVNVDCSSSVAVFEEALNCFNKVQELDPDFYGVWTQKGTVYGNLQRLDEAEQCYLKALQDDDEDFSAAYYLGCTYRDKGDEELAERYFALAHELNPDGEPPCGSSCEGN